MLKIKDIWKKLINSKNFTLIFFIFWFLFFIILSLFRDSRLDENIYFSEAVTISKLLKNGEWIGNYAVGLHGFLNKLILGILFIFTGPSVFLATMLNILAGIFSGVILFKILFNNLSFSKSWSLLGVTLLFSSYQFLTYIPTFYRDIFALLFVLLIFKAVLDKKSNWLVGVYLLLLLDSKEHVFFTLAPAIVIWIGIYSYSKLKEGILHSIKFFIFENTKLFILPLLYLLLMFFTSLIPLNIYNANILGLTEGGIENVVTNLDVESATYNRDIATNENVAKSIPKPELEDAPENLQSILLNVYSIFLSYLGKVLYPRTFSFLSIPFVVLVPSFLSIGRYFTEWFKKKKFEKLLLPISLVIYLLIYIVHSSVARYLIPISPVIYIFFLLFLRDFSSKKKETLYILLTTLIFTAGGLYFEYSYVWVKVAISLILLTILFIMYFKRRLNTDVLKNILVLLISVFTFGTAILASYTLGQIRYSLLYGYNRESRKIIDLVEKDETVWVNDINWDILPYALRGENTLPSQWRWPLKEWVPKKDLLIDSYSNEMYSFYWSRLRILYDAIEEYNIEKLVYIKLHEIDEREQDILLLQEDSRLEGLLTAGWLSLEKEVTLKNKSIYIFNVNLANE